VEQTLKKATDVSKLVRKARRSLGLNGESQQALLRKARASLGLTTEELAAALGKSQATLTSWLAPKGAAKHRTMPAGSRLLLQRILAEHKGERRGRPS